MLRISDNITRVSDFASATHDAAVFAETSEALTAALASRAGIILAADAHDDPRVLTTKNPKLAFAQLAKQFATPITETLIHPRAAVERSAKIGERCRIEALAVIEANAVIGDDCIIGASAVIHAGVVLGRRCVIQSGAVIGSQGFGYVRDGADGTYTLFPQQGTCVLEDDVEVGANTTIDRGALGETRIGRGTKIDNLVHIGHNCRVGSNVVIAAQVGISGSCVVEDGAILAGQVGISDHCHIGPGVILGGQAGVFRGATVTGPGQAFAGTPAEPIKDYLKGLAKVRRLK